MPSDISDATDAEETVAQRRVDHELIEAQVARAKDGDAAATEWVLQKYEYLVRSFAYHYFTQGRDRDRDDMKQDLRLALVKAVRDYKPALTGSFAAFASMCLQRQAISSVKASLRLKNMTHVMSVSLDSPLGPRDDEDAGTLTKILANPLATLPETAILNGELVESLRRAIHTDAHLSEKEAACFKLYLEGLSYDEVAAVVGISSKNVDNALQRTRKKVVPAILDAIEWWRNDLAV